MCTFLLCLRKRLKETFELAIFETLTKSWLFWLFPQILNSTAFGKCFGIKKLSEDLTLQNADEKQFTVLMDAELLIRSCHYYFLGLQRKQGVSVNAAKKFDIRSTVDEFKGNVGSYTVWTPGMDISVTHIKRRDIPAFVFRGGVRPTRPAKASVEERWNAPDTSAANSVDAVTSLKKLHAVEMS
ncbi:putative polynucleotide adenylyltransferase [Helianthus anomalus]